MSEDERPQEQPDEQPEEQFRPNPEHLAILKSGVEKWNAWRLRHPGIVPDLKGADLGEADLQGAHLYGANLQGASLRRADLQEAILGEADLRQADLREAHVCEADLHKTMLSQADLHEAQLRHADLRGADLRKADLGGANLSHASMVMADLQGAYLEQADLQTADLTVAGLQGTVLTGANLGGAELDGANITGADLCGARVEGTSFQDVRWRPEGGGLPAPDLYRNFDVRGLRFSDPLFDQFVRQSEFIRRTEEAMSATWRGWIVFHLWALTCDCGRSLTRWLVTCAAFIIGFAALFQWWRPTGEPLVSLADRPTTPFTNLYFSMVTFSTLGFGDVTPRNWVGELAVMAEVFLGYVLLGGLITILAMKLVPPR